MLNPVELRHIIHKNPELSFKEYKTTELLIENISALNSPFLKIHRPLETGLLAEYRRGEGEFLLFRADIDALPVKEETGLPFSSENNCMHACGHDVHSAILYGFLKYVVEENIDKNILFMFQPAEEAGGGAENFLDTGILKNYSISKAFALHVIDEYPAGTIASAKGILFASAMEVDVEFFGLSAHVAFPHKGKNAFNALRIYLDVIDKIPKSAANPFVYLSGKIIAGDIRNIIPAYARAEGSIRSLSSKESKEFYEKLQTILKSIKTATGVDYKLTRGAFCPEVIVNSDLYDIARNALSKKYKFIECSYKMTGEDFGFISETYPSFMFWLGTGKGKKYGLHNPKFFPDDMIINVGIDIYKNLL